MKEAGMYGTHLLTKRQIRFMEKLPEGHKVVSIRDGAPIVRRPDGRLSRVQPNGRLAATTRVERDPRPACAEHHHEDRRRADLHQAGLPWIGTFEDAA
jgi:hypothetical protein